MHFDVPKVVQSPGCDHGHDEESRNGRDIKIDILDSYIRTPEVFQVISEKPESRRVTGTLPGEVMGHMGLSGERERGSQGGPRASPLVRIGQGVQPPFPSPSPPLSFSPTPTRKGGVLLPVGVGLPPWRAHLLAGRLPLAPLYTGAGGHPRTHKLIHVIVP